MMKRAQLTWIEKLKSEGDKMKTDTLHIIHCCLTSLVDFFFFLIIGLNYNSWMKFSATKCSIIYLGTYNKNFCCSLGNCQINNREKRGPVCTQWSQDGYGPSRWEREKKLACKRISRGISDRNWELHGAVRSHLER